MNQHLQNYLHSFKLKKIFWETFLVDAVAFTFIILSFSWLSGYFQAKVQLLMQGKSLEQVQQWLSQTSPEQLLPFFNQMKVVLFWGLGGFALLLIASFLLYSLSNALIWNHLQGKKLGKYWSWNVLNLVLIILLVSYGALFLLIKLITMTIFRFLATVGSSFYFAHQALMDGMLFVLNNLVSFLLVLFFIVFVFFIYHDFVERKKIWLSIGEAFHFLKQQWGRIWRMVLLMGLTAVVLTLMLLPVYKIIVSSFWSTALSLSVSLLFLSWMRIYFLAAFEEKK